MYYYYDRDHYGREHCYEVADEELQKDKELTLDKLAGDAVPVWYIESWNALDWDRENEFDVALVKAITDYLSTGTTFPVILITHLTDDLDWKYECVNTESEIDYDCLIAEYASPHDFVISPTYCDANEYTLQQAKNEGKYALANKLRNKLKKYYAEENG